MEFTFRNNKDKRKKKNALGLISVSCAEYRSEVRGGGAQEMTSETVEILI